MNILIGTVLLVAGAIWIVRHIQKTCPEQLSDVLQKTRQTTLFMIPRVFVGLVGAGFLAELLPVDQVENYFGAESGFVGVLIATAFGMLVPGGPFVAFAIGASALKAGASLAPLMAFVSAWCVFNLNRTLTYELPYMGRRLTIIRHAVSLPVPIVLGSLLLIF